MNPLVLITGTIIILVFSWLISVRQHRYHGIPRFFSFESIFILTSLNLKVWFENPLSPFQILSWLLLLGSVWTAIAGFVTLKKKGLPGTNFEETTQLVVSGIYRHIRHPLYLSLLLLGSGIMLKDPGPVQIITGMVNAIALFLTALVEEKEMIGKFGEEYEIYMKNSKMFIPFVI